MHSFYQALKFDFRCWYSGRLDYPSHLHNHIEILYMLEGTCRVSVEGSEYTLGPDDILIVFPNQLHRYNSIDDKEGILMLLSPEYLTEFIGIWSDKVPTDAILPACDENRAVLPIFQQIVQEYNHPAPFSEAIMKGSLLYAVGDVLRRSSLASDMPGRTASAIKRILDYCHSHYTQELSLDDLSKALGLSRFYISHIFSNRLYIGFPEYINSLRVSYACELLKDGEQSMTRISQKTGFNNIRTFNRAFQKFQGFTPREYRRQMQETEKSE